MNVATNPRGATELQDSFLMQQSHNTTIFVFTEIILDLPEPTNRTLRTVCTSVLEFSLTPWIGAENQGIWYLRDRG